MKLRKHVDSIRAASILKNMIRAYPYLAVMGLIWGYLAYGSSGAVAGLMLAAAVSAWVGKRCF